MTTQFLAQDIEHFEGRKLKAYKDADGNWTIGVGHNIQGDAAELPQLAHLIGLGISNDQVDALLAKDIATAKTELDLHMPWWRQMNDPRQDVFVQLAFNMGLPRLLGFQKMLAAAHVELFDGPTGAAAELQNSEWFDQADQDQHRGEILTAQLRTGERQLA